jgi:hypothetical protein
MALTWIGLHVASLGISSPHLAVCLWLVFSQQPFVFVPGQQNWQALAASGSMMAKTLTT